MSAFGFENPRGTIVHGSVLRQANRRGGFECDSEVDWSAVGDAALNPAGIVGFGSEARGVPVCGRVAWRNGWGFDEGVVVD